jgi:hypothetical protein
MKETHLLQLIGLRVVDASVDPHGSFVLQFNGGERLVVVRDDSGYESYSIQHGNKEAFR